MTVVGWFVQLSSGGASPFRRTEPTRSQSLLFFCHVALAVAHTEGRSRST